jgi:hypothetical protein
MNKKKDRARDDEDQPFGGVLTGNLVQQLQRIQRNREEARQEREEREEAEELGISVFELRERKHYEANKPILIDPASIESTKLKWLWPERIPLGKITVFSGDPGLGKSYIALDIAARVSSGAEWPGEQVGRGDKEGGSEENVAAASTRREMLDAGKEEEGEMGKEEREGDTENTEIQTVSSDTVQSTNQTEYSAEECELEVQEAEKELSPAELDRLYILRKTLAHIDRLHPQNTQNQADSVESTNSTAGVLIISSEDDKSDTILPRLELLGANLSNFRFMNYVKDDGDLEPFSITRHINQLEIAVRKVKNCKLVIIDPLASYLDNMGGNSLSAVRKALDPLKSVAERCGVAVILINHLNKKSGAAIHRSAGSISIVGIARTVWGFTHCKHDRKRRLMVPLKNNLGEDSEGLAYSITNENGLVWDDEPVEIQADEAFGDQAKIRGRDPYALRKAMDWLRYKLSSGEPVPQTMIEADAQEAGIKETTLRRAKQKLGIIAKHGHAEKCWLWQLPLVQTTVV